MEDKSDIISDTPRELPFQLLTEITNSFAPEQKLGSGTFGAVYMGVFKDGQVIAVKKLHFQSEIDDKQFKNEYELLRRLKHQNIVQLVGFCNEITKVPCQYEGRMVLAEEIHRALCLEFVPNGDLHKFLSEQRLVLNWNLRFKIIKGICEGLKYLHDVPLNHLDLKPANILLDDNMVPKIADFGISRLMGTQNTVKTSTFLGTLGYIPPEFINKQIISRGFDIFSLGVIIKKIVTMVMDDSSIVFEDGQKYIAHGICEGLKCLHDEHINHLYLKSDNILLDDKMVPYIADFGKSRLVGTKNTVRTLSPLGTFGYMPPEFIMKQVISREFDIFSLGVITKNILIVVMEDPSIAFADDQDCIALVHSYWKKMLQGMPGYTSLELDCKQVRTCIEIAVVCMDEDPRKRPMMKYIVNKLNNIERKGNHSFSPIEQFQDSLPEIDIPKRPSRERGEKSGILSTLPKNLSFDFLKQITYQFSNERLIGQSAFGDLYQGIMPDGTVIAVKKLAENSPVPRDKAFSNEVQNIMALHHENVVELLGYCHEGQKKVMLKNGRYIVADVFENLICYEYLPKGSLHKNLFGSNGMDWNTRFKIIKGVCNGLYFIHGVPIIHIDLKPENIFLDHNMLPKIAEFGMSRLLDQEQTRLNTYNVVGSNGYMAPEYLYKGEISTKSDIYGLGLLILETTTGEKNSGNNDPSGRKYIDEVRYKWTEEYIASKYSWLNADSLEEIKLCIRIGLECVEVDQKKRPSIEYILDLLDGRLKARSSMLQETPGFNSPLIVQPPELRFPFEPKRQITCSFSLTNTTDVPIAFKLLSKRTRRYLTKLPLCGVVPPKCIYTVNVTMLEQKQQPSRKGEFLTLQSSKARKQQVTNAHPDSLAGDEVKEVKLPVVCDAQEGTSSNQSIQSAAEIIASHNYQQVLSVDVHPNKPWILMSNRRGNVCIWNYQTQAEEKCFEVGAVEPDTRSYRLPFSPSFRRKLEHKVYSATFIEREGWLVAGGGDGYIYVYSYDTMEEIKSFKAHDGHHIRSLAASPTHSFLLSASDDHRIKIWDWKSHWECMRTFLGHGNCVTQVMFDPNDSTSFASTSLDHTIKMWDSYSPTCNVTLDGQPDGVLCLHYFTDQNQQFLLSGSWDGAANIWDPEKECCVSVLSGDAKSFNALCWHPDLRLVIAGSLDGTVQVWKSTGTTYRLENIIGLNLGAVNAIAYIKGLRRIVVGCEQGMALMEINLPQKEAIVHTEDSEDDLTSRFKETTSF